MGLLRAQAIGHVHGITPRVWQPCSSEPTVTNQDLIVAPLKQTVAHASEKSRATFDICSSVKACTSSFMCVDVQSCSI